MEVNMNPGYQGGSPASFFVSLIISIVVYIFLAYCLKRICEKAGGKPGVLIWIPLLQVFPMLAAAKKPAWWFILMLIPVINFIIGIIVWIEILKNMGKNPANVLLFFIPFVNIIYFLILAFGK